MEEVEETNYRAGNGLTRRVQGVGEELEGVTLPSPFAAEMTEAEADALVNNHQALYQQALKHRETIASSVGKTKCVHTLSGVPVPQKKSRAAKSGGQKGKRRRKAGATTGSQADLPTPASTEEELVTDGLPDLPLPASSQQQQQTVTNLNPLPAGSQQQLLASSLPNRPLEAQQKLAGADSECEILRSRLVELEAQQAGGVSEMSSDGPIVNPANLTRDNNGNVIVKTSLEKKEFAVKALDTFTWLITDAPVECMEFFPTFEVFQPHLITKYQLCGVNRDEYFYATGGRIEFEKLVMKVIKTKRSNTHKKVRFYAWGAGGLVDESKWPLLAVEQIIPSKKRTEEKWLEEFRHEPPPGLLSPDCHSDAGGTSSTGGSSASKSSSSSSSSSSDSDSRLSNSGRGKGRHAGGKDSAAGAVVGNVNGDRRSHLPGCILQSDSRQARDYVEAAGYDYFERNGRSLPFWMASKAINQLYANRHGYRYVNQDTREYNETRHPSWLKLLFIRDQLRCCCAWAFYLDSDAYFRMDNHRLPIEAWLAGLPFTGAFNWIRDRYGMELTNQTWMPQFPIGLLDPPPADVAACSQSPAAPCAEEPSEELIGLFARNSGEENGASAALFNASLESINAGVMLLRRSPLTFKFLDTWYNEEPSNRHLQEATWEQNRLNRIAPLFAKHLVVVPYLELTGPEGRQVRHVWSMVGRHRDEALRVALLGALLANELATKEDDWTPRGVVEKWAHDEMDARQ
ncbi:unnamed protein product [Closterium sp. NIES-64]|nr:unnamed protein product [Closterium sp. NIES-64]